MEGVRSVIVLDDCITPEPEPDEDWECLDLEDEGIGRGGSPLPTYAEVTTTAAEDRRGYSRGKGVR